MSLAQRRLWLLSLAVAFTIEGLPGSAFGQSSGPVFPPSIVITNYDRVLVGEEEALESGAFVARVGDSTSGWYNPAGMMLVEKTAIGGSGTGFETDVLTLQGVQKSGGGFSIGQLPSFFGVVLGKDAIDLEHWRFGFSITKPVSWSQSVAGGAAGTERLDYSSTVAFQTLIPSFAVAFGPLPCLRFGVGVGVALTALDEVQTLSAQLTTATTANAFLRSLIGSGSAWDLTASFGGQWDILQTLVLGVSVRLPGVKIFSSGSLVYQNVDNNGTPWSNVFFRDRQASFDYKLPLDVNFGLGWHSESFALEADVRYHSAISDYALLSSQNKVQVTTTGPGGVPVVTQQPFPSVTNGAKAVWNWAVGARVNVTKAWSLHAGFFSDYSPTMASSQNLFRSVNMYGATVGTRIAGEHLSGSVGFGFDWGSSQTFAFGDPASGAVISTKLNVRTFSLLYALTYVF
jgi:hypothetical protein